MSTLLEDTAVMATYARWPVEFARGSGAHLFDARGRRYLDMTAGLAVANVGHAHPRVAAAVSRQAAQLLHVSNLYRTVPQEDLARRLQELSGGMPAFFCNSGAEAIECALKLVRRWALAAKGPNTTRMVAAHGGFHGRTLGALSATGQPAKQTPFAPLVPGFVHVPFGDLEALAGAMDDSVAGILLEPIQGEGGVVVPPADYLAGARALCDEHGALLVFDEVQTGVGRTGRWFAHEHWGIAPDVVCLAKGLAGGLPMGACLARPEVAAAFQVGDHATTFGGGPVQSAAALAVLDVIGEGLLEHVVGAGNRLRGGLARIFGSDQVRGLGLMLAVELEGPIARSMTAAALDKGLLVNDVTPTALRLTPPLVVTDEDIDEAVHILGEVVREVDAA